MDKKKKITTALFADISGFTRFSEKNKTETTQKLLEQFYRIAKKVATDNNGTFTEITGDEVSLHFDTPKDSLIAAKDLQSKVKFIFKQYDPLLDVRIGIHTGEAIFWHVEIANILFPYVTGNVQIIAERLENSTTKGKIAISKKTISLINIPELNQIKTKKSILKGFSTPIEYIEI